MEVTNCSKTLTTPQQSTSENNMSYIIQHSTDKSFALFSFLFFFCFNIIIKFMAFWTTAITSINEFRWSLWGRQWGRKVVARNGLAKKKKRKKKRAFDAKLLFIGTHNAEYVILGYHKILCFIGFNTHPDMTMIIVYYSPALC